MNSYDVKRLIEMEAIKTEIEGMKAENEYGIIVDNKISYGEKDFLAKAEELRVLASKPDEEL